MTLPHRLRGAALAALALAIAATPTLAQTSSRMLASVKERGTLRCGVNPGLAGFSFPGAEGKWQGLDVDVCRAVAAAALGSADKVTYIPLSAKDRFTALQTGEIDVLARNASWTLSRNAQLGITFVAPDFYDGQAFMVKAASGVKTPKDLDGATFCIVQGTTTEKTMADYFKVRGWAYQAITYADGDAVAEAYTGGRCDALTTDRSQLAGIRMRFADPAAHVILPDIISKELLSFAVRNGDDGWANVVRWSFYAMLEAEELGLTSANVRATASSSSEPAILQFAGRAEDYGRMLGLDREWALRIVEQVGNYAESYERNIAPLGLERGANRLWRDGGLMISPPVR